MLAIATDHAGRYPAHSHPDQPFNNKGVRTMERRKVGNDLDDGHGVGNGVDSRRVGIVDDDRATRARSDNNRMTMAIAIRTPTRYDNDNCHHDMQTTTHHNQNADRQSRNGTPSSTWTCGRMKRWGEMQAMQRGEGRVDHEDMGWSWSCQWS